MSLGPPRKRPEGLIDGCFGVSAYCDHCDYEKEFMRASERLCASCARAEERARESGVPRDIMDIAIDVIKKEGKTDEN